MLLCTSVTYLLVESTSFFSCSTSSSSGGVINFSNSNNGQCVLNEVCGYDCCLTYTSGPHAQFAYIYNTMIAFFIDRDCMYCYSYPTIASKWKSLKHYDSKKKEDEI